MSTYGNSIYLKFFSFEIIFIGSTSRTQNSKQFITKKELKDISNKNIENKYEPYTEKRSDKKNKKAKHVIASLYDYDSDDHQRDLKVTGTIIKHDNFSAFNVEKEDGSNVRFLKQTSILIINL